LGATVRHQFAEEGFVYELEGPFELLSQPQLPFNGQEREPAAIERSDDSFAACRVLVVEDEALVALQLQGDLEQDGHKVVGPARSLKDGLLLASREEFDAALVDVSLGRDTSAPIADQLLARNIPFAFATGYSDTAMLPDHLRDVPKLSKPYALAEIRGVLSSLIGQRKTATPAAHD
jgi:CheY-like chemotaxis protein